MPRFVYDGNTPGTLDFSLRRGDRLVIVLPQARLEADAYTEEVVEGVTLYTVTKPFDLTGTTWAAAIGTKGGTPVCTPTVTHDGAGGELTITITTAESLAIPSGRYSFELAEVTTGARQDVLIGTVRVYEGPIAT